LWFKTSVGKKLYAIYVEGINKMLVVQIIRAKRAGDTAQVAECLLIKCKVLSSIPRTAKTKTK
jgi:hypothetical protein